MKIRTFLNKVFDRQRSIILEDLTDSIFKRIQTKPDRKFSMPITPYELNELRDCLEEKLTAMGRKQDSMLVKVLRSVNELYEQYITAEFTLERGKYRF
jgi:ribosomal protein L31E